MMLGVSQAYEYRAQHSKYVCLDESDKQFKAIHKHHERKTEYRHRSAYPHSDLTCYEDNTRRCKDKKMKMSEMSDRIIM